MKQFNDTAYVLLSGGQDSFVSLVWAMQNFSNAEAVSIDYGQRHNRELHYAAEIAKHFGVNHTIYDIGNFIKTLAESTLLSEGDHNKSHPLAQHLPASFVPNRNGIFLTIISNHAFRKNEKRINIVIGTCETDFSGYPDCREKTIAATAVTFAGLPELPVHFRFITSMNDEGAGQRGVNMLGPEFFRI